MNKNRFEDFLRDWHAESYHGTDDDMPDAFESWLGDLEQQSLIELADVAMFRAEIAGMERARQITMAAFEKVTKADAAPLAEDNA